LRYFLTFASWGAHLLRNTRKTLAVSSTPAERVSVFFLPSRRAAAPVALRGVESGSVDRRHNLFGTRAVDSIGSALQADCHIINQAIYTLASDDVGSDGRVMEARAGCGRTGTFEKRSAP
jgi:hypothetical protein